MKVLAALLVLVVLTDRSIERAVLDAMAKAL